MASQVEHGIVTKLKIMHIYGLIGPKSINQTKHYSGWDDVAMTTNYFPDAFIKIWTFPFWVNTGIFVLF